MSQTQAPKLSDCIRALELKPFDAKQWEVLRDCVRQQGDPFSLKTLEILIKGISSLHGKNPDSRPIRDTFCRLVRSYNNPVVIRAAAKHFLMELNLPDVARDYLVHAKQLGLNDSETAQLLTQAEAELRRRGAQLINISNEDAAKSIRRTGKLSLLPSPKASVDDADEMRSRATVPLDSIKIEDFTEQAAACLISGDLVSARRALKKGMSESRPERYWELWTELGTAHYDKGQFLDARSAYSQACEIFPERMVSQFNLGTAKLLTRDFAGALACFQKADDIQSFEPKVLCNVGATYFLQDEYELAEEILRETIKIRPDYVRALNTLSSALGSMNRLQESLELCEKVLELSPGHPEAAMKKGVLALNHGDLEVAVDCLTMATVSPELQIDAECYLAQALSGLMQTQDAEDLLKSALETGNVDPDLAVASWKAVGRSWREQNETNRAVTCFQSACQLAPRDPEPWLDLGITYGRANHDSYARECFQSYLRLNPEGTRRMTVDSLLEMSRG